MKEVRILLIDPCSESRALVRQLVRAGLPGAKVLIHDLEAEGLPGSGHDWTGSDVVLLECALGAHGDGLAWLRREGARATLPPVVVLAGSGNEYVAVEAIKSGAENYLNKNDLAQRRLVALLESALRSTTRTAAAEGAPTRDTHADDESPAPRASPDDGGLVTAAEGIPGYRILRQLGEGATSKVYLAEKSGLEPVVLKVLDLALMEDDTFLERFLQEADLVLKIDNPHIVKIFEQAFTDAGCFIAMEHLSGGDLKGRIKGEMSAGEALSYFAQILEGLEAIHQLGIVHRDLKPANILFRAGGTLAIADFGISKEIESSPELTDAGSLLGTPHYISPEQWQGDAVDARSDLYGAGIIFFEMLTGHKPYEGTTLSKVSYQHRFGDLPTLDPAFAAYQPLIERTLAKNPEARGASAAEVLDALHGIIGREDLSHAGAELVG